MYNFKEWLLNEELWQNKTATVYHRTGQENLKGILSSSWITGANAEKYGAGLYTLLSIDDQFNSYLWQIGDVLLKFKVTNLDQYIICHKPIAQQILGINYKISDQFKKFGLDTIFKPEQIKKYDQMMETNQYSDPMALEISKGYYYWQVRERAKGIIFRSEEDGYNLLKYQPIEDGTITLLGYILDAKLGDKTKVKEIKTNCKLNQFGKCENPWTTATDKIALKSLWGSNRDEEQRASLVNLAHENVPTLYSMAKNGLNVNKFFQLKKAGKIPQSRIDRIIASTIKKQNIEDSDVIYLLFAANDIDNVVNMTGTEIFNRQHDYVNLGNNEKAEKIAELFFKHNKNLRGKQISSILDGFVLNNKFDSFKKLASLLSKDDLNKLDSFAVYNKIKEAERPVEAAEILGHDNMQKLEPHTISDLLIRFSKENTFDTYKKLAKLFPTENFNKLEPYDLTRLISFSPHPRETMEILGPDNLRKLDADQISKALKRAEEIKNQDDDDEDDEDF